MDVLTFSAYLQEQGRVKRRVRVKDWLVALTKHAMERIQERRGDLSQNQWNDLYQRMVKKVEERDLAGEVLFYSRKLKQGLVVAIDQAKHALRVITTLPVGKQFAKPGTQKVMMEGYYFTEVIDLEDDL